MDANPGTHKDHSGLTWSLGRADNDGAYGGGVGLLTWLVSCQASMMARQIPGKKGVRHHCAVIGACSVSTWYVQAAKGADAVRKRHVIVYYLIIRNVQVMCCFIFSIDVVLSTAEWQALLGCPCLRLYLRVSADMTLRLRQVGGCIGAACHLSIL